MNSSEAMALKLPNGEQLLIPFGATAHLVWTRTGNQTAALGLLRRGNKTLNLSSDGSERVVRMLEARKAQRVLGKLREKPKFREFEQRLREKGKRLAESKLRVLLDETSNTAILGLANEGSERIAHQLRIRLKANKDDELEENAEPQVQATACGQAGGEAVASAATLQPQFEGDVGGGTGSYTVIEGGGHSEICTSQWGYTYSCYSTAPALNLSSTSLEVATFVGQNVQASVTVWNSGGGTLTGSATTAAPFSIVSGGSFSLGPGQPQTVTVRFAPASAGGYSGNLQLSSNGGAKAVALKGTAHRVTLSAASLDFGSTLITNKMEQRCTLTHYCYEEEVFVAVPVERKVTVRNEGNTSVELILNVSAPYQLVSEGRLMLTAGQSKEVTLRFHPAESGSFPSNLQLSLQPVCLQQHPLNEGCALWSSAQGSLSVVTTGIAHKISIEPEELNFGVVFIGNSRERTVTIKNEGTTTVTLEIPATTLGNSPYFRITALSQNPLVLGPGQSGKVSVEFRAIASATYADAARLLAGTLSLEIPLLATAMTYQEYVETMLKAHNTAVRNGRYGMVYVTRQQSRFGMLLSGFEGLSFEQTEQFYDDLDTLMAGSLLSDSSPDAIRYVQALAILEAINLDELGYWLERLAQARQAGRFAEEYASLLPQGLDRVQQAILLLKNSSDPQVAWNFLDQVVRPDPGDPTSPGTPHWSDQEQLLIRFYQGAAIARMIEEFEVEDEALQHLMRNILQHWDIINQKLRQRLGIIRANLAEIARIIYRIIDHICTFNSPSGPNDNPADLTKSDVLLLHLRNFFQWLSWEAQTDAQLEHGLGIFYTARNILQTSPSDTSGWLFRGLIPLVGRGQWMLLALLPGERAGLGGKGVVALIRGDHCSSCANRVDDIITWLTEALTLLPNYINSLASGGFGMAVLNFTKAGTTGVTEAVDAVNQAFADNPFAVVSVWIGSDGNVYYSCVGMMCSSLEQGGWLARRACRLAGRPGCSPIRYYGPGSGMPPKMWNVVVVW
jgi:hypothetical protein